MVRSRFDSQLTGKRAKQTAEEVVFFLQQHALIAVIVEVNGVITPFLETEDEIREKTSDGNMLEATTDFRILAEEMKIQGMLLYVAAHSDEYLTTEKVNDVLQANGIPYTRIVEMPRS